MFNRLKRSLAKPLVSITACFAELALMGNSQAGINKAIRDRDAEIAKVQDKYDPIITAQEKKRAESFERIHAYVIRNISLFNTPNPRSRKSANGQFGVRSTTPKIELVGEGELSLIEKMRADKELAKYVRVTYTLDREAMLADRPEISGVVYSQHDEVFAKPTVKKEEGKSVTLSLDIK